MAASPMYYWILNYPIQTWFTNLFEVSLLLLCRFFCTLCLHYLWLFYVCKGRNWSICKTIPETWVALTSNHKRLGNNSISCRVYTLYTLVWWSSLCSQLLQFYVRVYNYSFTALVSTILMYVLLVPKLLLLSTEVKEAKSLIWFQ